MRKWLLTIIAGLTVAGALFFIFANSLAPQRFLNSPVAALTAQPVVSEAEAIRKGVELARQYGLQGETWGVAARQMTLVEAVRLTGGDMRLDLADAAAKAGRHPSMPVWVVVVRGKVAWNQPGPTGSRIYDNIFLFINAVTGEGMDYGAMGENAPLLLYVPVTPGIASVRITVTPPAGPLDTGPAPIIPPTATLRSPLINPTIQPSPISPTVTPTLPGPYPQPTRRP